MSVSTFGKGDQIRVTSGPYKGAVGTVVSDRSASENVLVSLPYDSAHNVVRGRNDAGDGKRVSMWEALIEHR